jgi:hypothetical protein
MNQANATAFPENDPRHHTIRMRNAMRDLAQHLREDVNKIDEPQARALFETSAEVLGALAKAFEDYEQKKEPAFRAQGA